MYATRRICRGAAAVALLFAAPPSADALEPCTPTSQSKYDFVFQGWDDEQRHAFWFTSQGSQLIPYDWFAALNEAGKSSRFCDPAHMEALGYLPVPPLPRVSGSSESRNRGGYPIGFAEDEASDGTRYVGLTCAACHTGRIDARGKRIIVEGGPALADFDRFLRELVVALEETAVQPARLEAFARKLGQGTTPTELARLKSEIEKEVAPLRRRVNANRPQGSTLPADHPGFGRIDAYGQIFNQVLGIDLEQPPNIQEPDGPASYPALWNGPHTDRVQWNGAAENRGIAGHMLRNLTEVIGVFGRVEFDLPVDGYTSQVDFIGLGTLEGLLWKLRAPKWTDVFDAPDPALVARGRAIYTNPQSERRCVKCHALPRDDPEFQAVLVPIEVVLTDRKYAVNASERRVKTGELEGRPKFFVTGELLGAEENIYPTLLHVVIGTVFGNLDEALRGMWLGSKEANEGRLEPPDFAELNQRFRSVLEDMLRGDDTMPRKYRARSHAGIWATAPYLHNGSVPNLVEFLKAPDDRVPKFFVGSRVYDEQNVGLDSAPGAGLTELDTTVTGNSQLGHTYTEQLTGPERAALLEFLKTL